MEILNMQRGPRHQCNVAIDAAESPRVLILEVAARRPTIYLDCDQVLSRFQVSRNVEFGRHTRILAIAHPVAVDPYVECRIDAIEHHENLASLPGRGHREGAPVRANRVALSVGCP